MRLRLHRFASLCQALPSPVQCPVSAPEEILSRPFAPFPSLPFPFLSLSLSSNPNHHSSSSTNQFCNISDDDGPCVALQFRLCLIKSHHTRSSVRDCHCHCHLSSSTQHKSDRPFLASSLVSYWKAQLPHHRQPVHRPTNQPLDAKTKAHENGTGQDRTGQDDPEEERLISILRHLVSSFLRNQSFASDLHCTSPSPSFWGKASQFVNFGQLRLIVSSVAPFFSLPSVFNKYHDCCTLDLCLSIQL